MDIRAPPVEVDEKLKYDIDTSPSSPTLSTPIHNAPTYDSAVEKRILRKCNWRVIPPVFCLFMVTFWDRVNIGNAKIQGLTEELDMHGTDFNVATLILFVPFILFEIPENLILKKLKPYQWLSFLMFGCGISNMAMGFVKTKGALIGVRFLLGMFEAGIGPGSVFVISSYYRSFELPSKLSIWYLSGIAGAAFGGLLAYGIVRMDGMQGYSGWRWIFIVEGAITAAIGLISYFWLVDWPENAKFLTDEERAILLARLKADRAAGVQMERWNTRRLFGDWRIWIGTLMYMCIVCTTYSTSFYSPSILVEMGYTAINAQLHSFPPYAVAVVCCLGFCMASDHFKHRYGFLIGGMIIGVVGYAIMLSQSGSTIPVGAEYFALFCLVSSAQIVQPLTVAWMMNNVGGHYKRAFASACQIGFGNAGGIIASNIYFDSDPFYRVGFGVSLALLLLNGALATLLLFLLKRENKQREHGAKQHLLQAPDADNLGDDHPSFRFVY